MAESKIIGNPVVLTNVKTVEFRSGNGVISIIFMPITISTNSPEIWVDIKPTTKTVVFYNNTGSGYSLIGEISFA